MSSDHAAVARTALAEVPAPEELARTAALDVPVLVTAANSNERGTYARLLHARSSRSEQLFVEFQCSRRSDTSTRARTVTSDELQASLRRARGETLYLDDVGTLDARCQTWLRSHLNPEMITHRVRLISGSDGSLVARVADGQFDPYLFYRLNVIHVDRS